MKSFKNLYYEAPTPPAEFDMAWVTEMDERQQESDTSSSDVTVAGQQLLTRLAKPRYPQVIAGLEAVCSQSLRRFQGAYRRFAQLPNQDHVRLRDRILRGWQFRLRRRFKVRKHAGRWRVRRQYTLTFAMYHIYRVIIPHWLRIRQFYPFAEQYLGTAPVRQHWGPKVDCRTSCWMIRPAEGHPYRNVPHPLHSSNAIDPLTRFDFTKVHAPLQARVHCYFPGCGFRCNAVPILCQHMQTHASTAKSPYTSGHLKSGYDSSAQEFLEAGDEEKRLFWRETLSSAWQPRAAWRVSANVAYSTD
ncbi:MAG: uncharacterized protein KVP18_002893 [Porospora cf. gigantea A]|uniref:uncharacterized protein n=1 Tax=Porospora cf. gigantea A TaxID=2853593 RepID=UPI003559F5F3|nr:MAG: hypothetical protein KVP18_002893 [Porospora cf. gigantea A]